MVLFDCPTCKSQQTLHIKYAQYVNYLLCTNCNKKFTAKEFRKGLDFSDHYGDFEMMWYKQSLPSKKLLILFSGASYTAKMNLHKTRVHLYADYFNYDVVSIQHISRRFPIECYYSELIQYICEKHNYYSNNIEVIGFSLGGVPTLRLVTCEFKFKSIALISPVIPVFNAYGFNEYNEKDIILFNNLKDLQFIHSNKHLINFLKERGYKISVFDINCGHTQVKPLQKYFELKLI